MIGQAGLTAAARRKAGGFSLGMRQRLGIAAAMLGDPPVLMFDEPFNGMDPEGIVWMRGYLRSLAAEGRAVLVSSHLMSELQDAATHLVVIGRGQVIADANVAELGQLSRMARQDHQAPAPRVRAGDADRDAAAAALGEHFAHGRLTLDERLDATLTATTHGELSEATRELPNLTTRPAQASPPGEAGYARGQARPSSRPRSMAAPSRLDPKRVISSQAGRPVQPRPRRAARRRRAACVRWLAMNR